MTELSRIASELYAAAGSPKGLPSLFAMTDPDRTPDVVAYAKGLPDGAGLILRHFGKTGPRMASMDLASVASAKKLVYLIGADPDLAAIVGAKGVHWPERQPKEAASYKRHQPARLMTVAAHGAEGIENAKAAKADAVILGPVFKSESPSAGTPLGVEKFKALAAAAGLPVYALGGITAANAAELVGSGACGIAGIGAFLK